MRAAAVESLYDPQALERSPMLSALGTHAGWLRSFSDWPDRNALQPVLSAHDVVNASGLPLRLVESSPESYERQLYLAGELQFRERNWHDLFNVLAWIAYPKAKRELNRRHYLAAQEEGSGRGRVRDALTSFDESGAIVVSRDRSLLDLLQEFKWKTLFWERRDESREQLRVFLFGHA